MLETNYLDYPESIKEAMGQQIDYVNTYIMDVPVVDGEKYNFTSYSPEGDVWATGVVQVIATVQSGLTKVKVLENSIEGFVDKMFYINSDAKIGEVKYELLDEEKNKVGVFVTIDSEYQPEEQQEEEPVVEQPVKPATEEQEEVTENENGQSEEPK